MNDLAVLYTAEPALFASSVFVLGLIVGSFLNVVIYRLPLMLERDWRAQALEFMAPEPTQPAEPSAGAPPAADAAIKNSGLTLSHPRSACPTCHSPIKAWQNIPLVSWLALRGRCAHCHAPISVRYPLGELTTGVLSAWVAWRFGFGLEAACALLVTWCLIALTGIDMDHQLLPDDITLPLMWAGLLAGVVIGGHAGAALPVSPRDAIIGAAAGYLSLWLVYHAFKLVTGKEGMGYGDFKLLAALGAWLGWQMLPLIIMLSSVVGAMVGITLIVAFNQGRNIPIPFGPYLAGGGLIALFWGQALTQSYLQMLAP